MSTVGINELTVAKYIREQEKQDQITVSYTHLDVYKRQQQQIPAQYHRETEVRGSAEKFFGIHGLCQHGNSNDFRL